MAGQDLLDAEERALRRICLEFVAMPGLRLTIRQIQRLCGTDVQACRRAIESLTEIRFLYQAENDTYARLP